MLPTRRAVLIGAISGCLLMPPISIDFAGFPAYNKGVAASLGLMLGTLIFEFHRVVRFRLRWFDLPMLLWCLCPSVSSFSNGFGGLEPISVFIGQVEHVAAAVLDRKALFQG